MAFNLTVARACSSYECFMLVAIRLSYKLLGQGCVGALEIVSLEVLWTILGSYQTIWSLPLPKGTWHPGTRPDVTVGKPSIHCTNPLPYCRDEPYSWLSLYYHILRGFHMAFSVGAASQFYSSRHLVLSHLGLASYIVSAHIQCQASIYTLVVSRVFMAGAARQAGDADSSRAPGLTSGLQRSVNVHRGALLLVPQWQCINSFVFYTCMCSNVETSLSWTCHVSWLWISNIPMYFYFALYKKPAWFCLLYGRLF